MTENTVSSYRHILKATSILGGAAAVNMLISLVRGKIVALLLGPSGIGIMGMYMSITGLATSLASAGLNVSGVREVAAAIGSGDDEKVQRTLFTFRQLTLWLSIMGTLGLIAAAWWVAGLSFEVHSTEERWSYTSDIMLLSLSVTAGLWGNYLSALIQATGQVTLMAKLNVVTALIGAAVSITCFVIWREDGIAPSLLFGVLFQWAITALMARGLPLPHITAQTLASAEIRRRLLTLGGFMVIIMLMFLVVNMIIRVIIMKQLGAVAVGFFHSASALSVMYANYILGAMGTDFLPRLSSVSEDHEQMNRMVNEQTSVAMLLGLPGIIATISLSPLIIPLLYSMDFMGAVPLLQLFSIGVFGRLFVWPLSFALIAKNAVTLSLGNELIAHAIHMVALWWLIPIRGVEAAGYASIAVYIICPFVLYAMVRRTTGFAWSPEVWKVLIVGVAAITACLCLDWYAPAPWKWICNGILLLSVMAFTYQELTSAADVKMNAIVRRLRTRLGFETR